MKSQEQPFDESTAAEASVSYAVFCEHRSDVAKAVEAPIETEPPISPADFLKRLGSFRGSVLYIAPDFDAPLDLAPAAEKPFVPLNE